MKSLNLSYKKIAKRAHNILFGNKAISEDHWVYMRSKEGWKVFNSMDYYRAENKI